MASWQGQLGQAVVSAQQWTLSGQAELKAGAQPGNLAPFLAPAPLKFRLSGNVIKPRLQRL